MQKIIPENMMASVSKVVSLRYHTKPKKFNYLLLACHLILLPISVIGQDCLLGTGKIPCETAWYELFAVPDRNETIAHGVTLLSTQHSIVVGASKNGSYLDRMILKYNSMGSRAPGDGGADYPWFTSTSSTLDFEDIAWQKTVVDELRNRFFIMFAMRSTVTATGYNYFVIGHDLTTGLRLPGWTTSRHVGYVSSSFNKEFRGGLDIDSNGNVFTVLEDPIGIKIKKWNAAGDNITPSNAATNYFVVRSPTGIQRSFRAFGVRKNDNSFFLAFVESPNDLVVTLWNSSFTFLNKIEYSRELTPPSVIPATAHLYSHKAHPHFSDGFIDNQNNFVIAGTYSFKKEADAGQITLGFPASLKLGVVGTNLQILYEYYETEYFVEGPLYNGDPLMNVKAVGHNGNSYIMPDSFADYLFLVDANGVYQEHVKFYFQFDDHIVDPSGCVHDMEAIVNGISVNSGSLVLAGKLIEKTRFALTCGRDATPILTKAFIIAFSKPITIRLPDLTYEFDWRFFDPIPEWMRQHPIPWDPEPFKEFRGQYPWVYNNKTVLDIVSDFSLVALKNMKGDQPSLPISRLSKTFSSIPTGNFFKKSMKENLATQLKKDSASGSVADLKILMEATNAIALDQQVYLNRTAKVPAGKTANINYHDVANVTLNKIAISGDLALEIQNGLPAYVKGFDPLWPMATYSFKFNGKKPLIGPFTVSFDVSKKYYMSDVATLHILQWDGKKYKDVTSSFNLAKRTVDARVDNLSNLVLMSVKVASSEGDIAN